MFFEDFNQCNNKSWALVFEDYFDGSSLDLTKWEPWTGVPRKPPTAWHLPENIEVSDGILKIISKKLDTPYTGTWIFWEANQPIVQTADFDYTTGELWTNQKFSYGKFEARVKIPKGKGFGPAFWLYGGPPWNEIDIFEFGEDGTTEHHMTAHYDYDNCGKDGHGCSTKYTGGDFSNDFHIYTVIWEKDKIEWYVDGSLKRTDYRFYTILGQTVGCELKALTQYIRNEVYPRDPMNIVFNVAVLYGNNGPNSSTPFPNQMEVDWVRYYKKCDCNNDITITNPSQCPLEDEMYNCLVGRNIEVNCAFTIPQNKQLNNIANNSITLKPGFHANSGSVFSAKIDPELCESRSEDLEEMNIDESNSFINNIFPIGNAPLSNIEDKAVNVNIYPNPNEGSFVIEFDNFLDYDKYSLKIMTMQGQTVCSIDNIYHATNIINLYEHPKGIYILSLYHKETSEISFYKIVKL